MRIIGKAIVGFFFLLFISPIKAQSSHSSLRDPVLLKKFQNISHKILCTCGCNMPLAYCNHIGHCNAWPMRAIIEGLLLEGKDEKEIVKGFVYGFGDLVESHPAFSKARSKEYSYLLERFRHGLGEAILTKPKSHYIWVILILGFLLILVFSFLLLRKRVKTKKDETILKNEQELLKSLMDYAKKIE